MAIEPMEQFLVRKVVTLPAVGPVDLSITNSVLFMMIAAGLISLFFLISAKRQLVPGRLQALAEFMYTGIDGALTGGMIGDKGRPFLPLVFTLFLFIALMNFLGLLPGSFTATSQLAVTATLAVVTFSTVIAVGFLRNGLGFFSLFWPSNVNIGLALFLAPIEFFSFIIRPITLALRLFGNMLGGHVVMFVFSSFIIGLGEFALHGGVAALSFIPAGLSFMMVVALMVLELVVAVIQAFVFSALTCIYLNEVVNLGHGH